MPPKNARRVLAVYGYTAETRYVAGGEKRRRKKKRK